MVNKVVTNKVMMVKKACLKLLVICNVLIAFTGCVSLQQPMPNDPEYAPVAPRSLIAPSVDSGSIYQEGYSLSLFSDHRARRVGDILTVILQEKTQSSKDAETEFTKEDSNTLSGSASFGSSDGQSLNAATTADRDFTGEAKSDQSNSLSGNITVTVSDVLPNGVLMIRGEKWFSLNRGDEFIRISGMVRPEDVQPDNTVLSTKIANARIAYSGTGTFADTNEQGWFTQALNSRFFPF